jgi:hypothetical protein
VTVTVVVRVEGVRGGGGGRRLGGWLLLLEGREVVRRRRRGRRGMEATHSRALEGDEARTLAHATNSLIARSPFESLTGVQSANCG